MRRLGILLGAVVVLLGAAAGVWPGGDQPRPGFPGRDGPAVTATAALGSGAGGPAESRVQRDVGAGERHPGSRHDGLSGSPALAPAYRAWATALAGVLERAGHPERFGQILLRGPPAASV